MSTNTGVAGLVLALLGSSVFWGGLKAVTALLAKRRGDRLARPATDRDAALKAADQALSIMQSALEASDARAKRAEDEAASLRRAYGRRRADRD